MKYDIEALKALAERLERATGPMSGGEAIDCADLLVRTGWTEFHLTQLALTESLAAAGAALTLVEMLLPDRKPQIDMRMPINCVLWRSDAEALGTRREGPTVALAVMRSLVAALIAQAEQENPR